MSPPRRDDARPTTSRAPSRPHHRVDQVEVQGIPADLFEAPTIGAVRRARGTTGEQARVVLAVAIVEEAQRWAAFDRLVGILDACRTGTRPDLIARRLYVVALRLDPGLIIDDGRALHDDETTT